MPEVGALAHKVRSKNAGPFWLTIDVFCGTDDAFARISEGLSSDTVADRLHTPPDRLKRFDIADLNVVKFSLPRPQVQGSRHDRDMHGAAAAAIVAEIDID